MDAKEGHNKKMSTREFEGVDLTPSDLSSSDLPPPSPPVCWSCVMSTVSTHESAFGSAVAFFAYVALENIRRARVHSDVASRRLLIPRRLLGSLLLQAGGCELRDGHAHQLVTQGERDRDRRSTHWRSEEGKRGVEGCKWMEGDPVNDSSPLYCFTPLFQRVSRTLRLCLP